MTEIDLTPITRLEYDIDAILNDHAVAEPITRIELILADIVAGNTTTVEPVTRIETYLAIISGADYPVPEPVTRIETFLAIIAGEDYEEPEAVTRLEGLLAEWVEKGSGIWKTVTGTLLHITDALASPVKELSVAIEPQQSGSGDPSPTNIRPITGATGATIYNDPMYGGLITWNQMVQNGDISDGTSNWSASTYGKLKVDNGKLVLYTTTESSRSWYITQDETVIAGHKYFYNANIQRLCGTPLAGSAATEYQFRLGGEVVKEITLSNANDTYHIAEVYTAQSNRASINFNKGSFKPAVGDIFSIWNVFLLDLTVMFGEGNEPTTAEEVKALFPDDYYAYNAGTVTTVSAVNGEPYTHIPISWQTEAGTVYGGSVELVSGALTSELKAMHFSDLTWSENANFTDIFNGDGFIDRKRRIDGSNANGCYCDSYQWAKSDKLDTTTNGIALGNTTSAQTRTRIYVKDPRFSSPQEFVASFATYDPLVICPLATENEYSLTPTTVNTLAGENNIWADVNGTITLTYKSDGRNSDVVGTGKADFMKLLS